VPVLKGFKNFLMRGDVVVVAIGLMVALAFNTLIAAFTSNVITPLINEAEGGKKASFGLGVQLGHKGARATFINFGNFVSAVIYFVVFMAVVYFLVVVPYKAIQARRGLTVFGDPAPAKNCPQCLSPDLPLAATRCRYCTSPLEPQAA
jgi:large conductance mechanosensitive channel